MGLEGISINQLRVTPELNSTDTSFAESSRASEIKAIDKLANGQKVDPDKHKEHDSNDFAFEENEQEHEAETSEVPIEKIDLSDVNKYMLKLDEDLNDILIMEKSTGNILQRINADELSKFVLFSKNSCGSIINKKF